MVLLLALGAVHIRLNAQESAHLWLAPALVQVEAIPLRILPRLDNASLLTNEVQQRRAGRAPQFAYAREVDVRPQTAGAWEQLEDGRTVWRYRITSPGAYSLNLGFERFHLPEGAIFLLYDPSKEQVLGPFTPADNEAHLALWTPILNGDEAVLELQLPVGMDKQNADIQLRFVNHDFAGMAKTLAGNCNIDVLCGASDGYPEVEAFRDVIQSVATYTVDGKYHCTGFLVNNTAADCRPYFVTAKHCEVDSANAATVVVYWNYQNSSCRQVGSAANGRPGNGSKSVYNSGTIFRAAWSSSDMTLLELDDPIREDANAFFAGWNADTLLPAKGVASIHHASSEEKRFSYSTQTIYRGSWGRGTVRIPNGDHLIVPFWDAGVTEDGSSGGPLFNKQQQVIGQLHGGAAACGNQAFDSFGWMGTSWEGGGTAKTQLRHWLDPLNTGQKSIGGRWNSRCHQSLTADTVYRQLCAGATVGFTLSISSGFQKAVALSAFGMSDSLLFAFEKNPAQPGSSVRLSIRATTGTPSARYPVTIRGIDGQDTVYLNLILEVRNTPALVGRVSPAAGAVEVPVRPTLHWERLFGSDSFRITVASDPAFKFVLKTWVTQDTTLRLDSLAYSTVYYWKIQGLNRCGAGQESTFSFTTTPDWRVETQGLPVEVCNSGALPFKLFIGSGFTPPIRIAYTVQNGPPISVRLNPQGGTIIPGNWVDAIIEDLSPLSVGVYTLDFSVRDGVTEQHTTSKFTIKTLPARPQLTTPFADTAFLEDRPILSWKVSPGATTYTLEVSQSPTFEQIYQVHQVGGSLQKQLTSLPAGAFYWRVIATNACGSNTSDVRKFSVHTGNLSLMNTLQIALDPNPTDGLLRIIISDPVNEFSIDLYSINGQHLQHIPTQPAQTTWTLDLSKYPDGVYIVRMQHRLTSLSRRIVLQH